MDSKASHKRKSNKRTRQPNWSDEEKNLFNQLTEEHSVVLENRASDTASVKRKSQVWDQIVSRMRQAGFIRTKERLKQQLGRVRAANAKKAREALAAESSTSTEEDLGLVITNVDENVEFPPEEAALENSVVSYSGAGHNYDLRRLRLRSTNAMHSYAMEQYHDGRFYQRSAQEEMEMEAFAERQSFKREEEAKRLEVLDVKLELMRKFIASGKTPSAAVLAILCQV